MPGANARALILMVKHDGGIIMLWCWFSSAGSGTRLAQVSLYWGTKQNLQASNIQLKIKKHYGFVLVNNPKSRSTKYYLQRNQQFELFFHNYIDLAQEQTESGR